MQNGSCYAFKFKTVSILRYPSVLMALFQCDSYFYFYLVCICDYLIIFSSVVQGAIEILSSSNVSL